MCNTSQKRFHKKEGFPLFSLLYARAHTYAHTPIHQYTNTPIRTQARTIRTYTQYAHTHIHHTHAHTHGACDAHVCIVVASNLCAMRYNIPHIPTSPHPAHPHIPHIPTHPHTYHTTHTTYPTYPTSHTSPSPFFLNIPSPSPKFIS
jgi:hypothetical protein